LTRKCFSSFRFHVCSCFCLFMVEVKCCLPLSHRANMVSMVPLKLRRRRTTLIWLKAIPIQTKNFSALQTKLLQTRWKGNQFAYFSDWNINSILFQKNHLFLPFFLLFFPLECFLLPQCEFRKAFLILSNSHSNSWPPKRGPQCCLHYAKVSLKGKPDK